MQRFIDILEHFDPTIVYKRGKSNHLADWLSRPPMTVTSFPIRNFDPVHNDAASSFHFKIPDIEKLSWIDLQSIGEHLLHKTPLPSNLPESWVKKYFSSHDGNTYRFYNNKFLKILHYGELVKALIKLHEDNTHCSIGTLIRESRQSFWHLDIVLAAQEAYKTCPRCQIMTQPVDIHSQDTLRPVQVSPLFTRWGMDHTSPVRHRSRNFICNGDIDSVSKHGILIRTDAPNQRNFRY